jgi:GR25 family glycosyltransferase involved in LPS biosynthesis
LKNDQTTIYNRFKNRFKKSPVGKKLPGVDCVYIISMPQRKEYITSQINKLGINAVYFDAIKPSDLTESDYKSLSLTHDPRSRIYKKYTRFAVLMSFIMCFMDSLVKGYRTILIFEDDIIVNVTLETLINSIREFNGNPLDVFYMGYCFLNCNESVDNSYKYLVKLKNPDLLCCQSICLKTNILPGLIDYCFPMVTASDEMFRNFYIENNVNVCVPKSVYFTQNRSSLESLNESVEDLELFKTCKF